MIKSIKSFPKIFIKIFAILITIIGLIHVVVYFTFPTFFMSNQTEKLKERADILTEYIQGKQEKEIVGILEAYSKNINITAHLLKDVESGELPLIHDLQIDEKADSNYIFIEDRTVKTAEGKELSVQFISGTNLVNDALEILLFYLQFSFIGSLIFSLVFSYYYSKKLVSPLRYIVKTTKKMENRDQDAKFDENNKDELGEIGVQLNKVYQDLLKNIDDLEQANLKMLRIQEQKIAFIRGASHEFKTPLASIRILLENMLYGIGKYKDHDKYLAASIEEVDYLGLLVNETLESSRFEEWTKNRELFSLADVLSYVMTRYREAADNRKINFVCNVSDKLIVLINQQALDKLISNILSNAIKYSNENSVINIYSENKYLFIDNECDMLDKQELDNLFKIFYHSQVVRNNQKGTGLGLYIR